MSVVITGQATPHGTQRYAARHASRTAPGHFRELGAGVQLSSIGAGTYLGREDDATDSQYRQAVTRALERGINVVDTAINYRHQRSERLVGRVVAEMIEGRRLERDEVVIATKGGFIALDAADARDPRTYFTETYLEPGIVRPEDVVGGMHCIAPRYLEDQIDRSRQNLGVETLDVYFLHNPETQLDEVKGPEFLRRIREAFGALEGAAAAGKLVHYGTATWNGYRQDAGSAGFLALGELIAAARDVAGDRHRFRVIQLPYNLAMTEAFTRATQPLGGEMLTTLEAARRLGLYVMASASVYQGQLTRNLPPVVGEYLPGLASDAQRAIQFVRSTPGIGTGLVGMKSVAHVEENAAVAATAPLAWAEFKRLFSES